MRDGTSQLGAVGWGGVEGDRNAEVGLSGALASTDSRPELRRSVVAPLSLRSVVLFHQDLFFVESKTLRRFASFSGHGGCEVSGVVAREDAKGSALKGVFLPTQVVLLYSPSPPGTASIFTAKEFFAVKRRDTSRQ